MACTRPRLALMILAFAGALAVSSACAAKRRPEAVPAPAAPAAAPAAPVSSGRPAPLLGHLTREQIRAYASWQPLFAEPYIPDALAVAAIRPCADGLTVVAIVATWCPDSKREVPRFFAIMDGVGLGDEHLIMVGVDRTKKDAEGLTEKWGVTRVPTFIFLRDGREVGRFVERTPAGATLEGEIARLLAPKQ
jgi:thiol-disulfide isomerase/thioredoxin